MCSNSSQGDVEENIVNRDKSRTTALHIEEDEFLADQWTRRIKLGTYDEELFLTAVHVILGGDADLAKGFSTLRC